MIMSTESIDLLNIWEQKKGRAEGQTAFLAKNEVHTKQKTKVANNDRAMSMSLPFMLH